jgi:PilZ domain
MTQSRRVSPRIPYDEAICLARLDGKGRLYGRGLDLSGSGVSLVSTEACPIGTEIKFDLLLPHGPRCVSGKIVRVTAAPGGFELAVAFAELKPAVTTAIDHLISDRSKQVLPARLRIDGVDKPLRCEAHMDDNDQIVRLTAALPFLRLEGGVDVLLGEQGGIAAAGTIRKIAVDPSTSDGIPRLSVDVSLDDEPRARTMRYGAANLDAAPESVGAGLRDGLRAGQASFAPAVRLPPKNLPPPFGHPLPSVVVAAGLTRDAQAVESRPPRRRVHGTAEIVRRPDLSAWWSPAVAVAAPGPMAAAIVTERLAALENPAAWSRAWWAAVPIALVLMAAIVHLALGPLGPHFGP